MYLIHMWRTEFGKRNPINAGIKMTMKLNIDFNSLTVYRLYEEMVNEKNKLLA